MVELASAAKLTQYSMSEKKKVIFRMTHTRTFNTHRAYIKSVYCVSQAVK